MKPRVLLENKQLEVTLTRLCYQLIEVHNDFSNSVIIGLQPRGIYLAHRLHVLLEKILKTKINCGDLDITFYRDDFRKKELKPNKTNIDFIIEDKNVILVDDVLYTGRTIRAAMDAIIDLGRPLRIELLVLVDRGHRELPIRANYIGKNIPTSLDEVIKVFVTDLSGDDKVVIKR